VIATAIFLALFAVTLRRGVADPVCGMTVDPARALRAEHGGRTHFFCSEDCRDRFVRAAGRT
jgi:YHS domain-containing protein